MNGASSTSVGTGVATTLLFGGIGLLGFLAKNHDYDFMVDGYDKEGKQTSLSFKFINKKPVEKLTSELYRVTGLGMGRQRSIAEIKALESGDVAINALGSKQTLTTLSKSPRDVGCAVALKDFNCDYEKYLEANPSVKAWANKNPSLAAKEKIRLGALTEEEKQTEPNTTKETAFSSLGPMDSPSSVPIKSNTLDAAINEVSRTE